MNRTWKWVCTLFLQLVDQIQENVLSADQRIQSDECDFKHRNNIANIAEPIHYSSFVIIINFD